MGFLNFFESKPAVSTPAPAAAPSTTQQQTAAPGTIETAPNPFAVNDPAAKPTESPVPDFNKLWEPIATPTPDPNAPKPVSQEDRIKQTIEAARQIDFTKVIPQDTMAKISAGGQDAQAAFVEAINLVNQATYAQSTFAADARIEQAIAKAGEEFKKQIPAIVRQHNLHDTLRGEDPRYKDPEIAPLLTAIDQQISLKFPDATAAQVNSMRSQYLDRVTGKLNPKPTETPTKDPRNGEVEDWTFLMSNS